MVMRQATDCRTDYQLVLIFDWYTSTRYVVDNLCFVSGMHLIIFDGRVCLVRVRVLLLLVS